MSNDEACLALKMYLGHIIDLKDKCDYILVPRMYSIKKNEQVCTNFNCLYDLVNNLLLYFLFSYVIMIVVNIYIYLVRINYWHSL